MKTLTVTLPDDLASRIEGLNEDGWRRLLGVPDARSRAAATEMLRSLPNDLSREEADAAFLSLYDDAR